MISYKKILTKILVAINNLTPTITTFEGNTINVASGSNTTVLSITLQPGFYHIVGTCVFDSNANGYRDIHFSASDNGSSGINRFARARMSPVSGANTVLHVDLAREITSTTTLYLVAYQNSGSTLSVTYPGIQATKLG